MKPITELWAPVLLDGGIFKDDYLVSNMGRVKERRRLRDGSYQFVLINVINSKRPLVRMTGDCRKYRKSLAKLVLSSFNYREGCECANITYLDGNMKNCELANLRYTSDRLVYEAIEAEKKGLKPKKYVKRIRKPKPKPVVKPSGKSCSNCKDYPCFDGIENLSSDFGAAGCRRYKLKPDIDT